MATAAKLDTIVPTSAPSDGQPERIAAAVTREAFAAVGRMGGSRGQWVAIAVLTGAFVWHIMGDGTVREESRKTKVLVEWLVRRDLAREHGEPLPQLPYDLL